MPIHDKIHAFRSDMAGEHHRYRSWEHCYRYFHENTAEAIAADRDHAALQLGFYLASWGMYRGSSLLLQHAYTVHRGVVDLFVEPRFCALRKREFGASDEDTKLVPLILEVAAKIRVSYRPFAPESESRQASDTLVTKVILGTFGCLPACDRFFIDGWRSEGLQYSYLNSNFIERTLRFCRNHIAEFREEQARIAREGGMRYPLMKLVDMYFWEIGYERDRSKKLSLVTGRT
jgi:hypothetical protein